VFTDIIINKKTRGQYATNLTLGSVGIFSEDE